MNGSQCELFALVAVNTTVAFTVHCFKRTNAFNMWFLFVCIAVLAQAAGLHPSSTRHVELVNESGNNVAVDWLNPATGDRVPFAESAMNGERVVVDSYVNHTFVVRLLDGSNRTVITVSEDAGDQVYVLKDRLTVERLDSESRQTGEEAQSIMETCRQRAKKFLLLGQGVESAREKLLSCFENEAAMAFQLKNEELIFQNELLKSVSFQAENCTCADPEKSTTTHKETQPWNHDRVSRKVGILHDRQASKIHIIEEFISTEECEAITAAAAPSLHRGTVADGKGGSRLSEHRKLGKLASKSITAKKVTQLLP